MGMLDHRVEDHKPSAAFELLPVDWYTVEICESVKKDASTGGGAYLKLTLKIIQGEHAGRLVWDNLNLWNKNAQAAEIARGQLSSICQALGLPGVDNPWELHGKPLQARIGVQPPKNGYDASNRVKGYRAAEQAAASVPDFSEMNPPPPSDADTPSWT